MYALPSGQILHLDTTRPGPQDIDGSRSAGSPEEGSLSGDFHTTRWTLVLEAKGTESELSRRALSELCSSYWQPLFLFVVRRGTQWDEARDLTQAFFVHLLEQDFLKGVDQSAGKFRSFLLASLKHFLTDETAKARALKRGGGSISIPLDGLSEADRPKEEPSDGRTPEDEYERQWALTILRNALDRLREDERSAGRGNQFEKLKGCLTGEGPETPYARLAEDLELSEAAVKMAVRRLRKRFGKALRAEVAETITRSEELDEEVRHLLTVLRS